MIRVVFIVSRAECAQVNKISSLSLFMSGNCIQQLRRRFILRVTFCFYLFSVMIAIGKETILVFCKLASVLFCTIIAIVLHYWQFLKRREKKTYE